MFEDSLLESQPTPVSIAQRWTMAGSTLLQVSIAALLLALPLFHPERLAFHVATPLVFTPPPPRLPLPVQQAREAATQASPSPALPLMSRPLIRTFLPSTLPSDPAPIANLSSSFDTGRAIPSEFANADNHGPQISAAVPRQRSQRVKVSDGVSAGIILTPIRPVYPAIARAARVSGQVVVEAVISKTGTLESLHVTSGPEMLRIAAMDAIRAARYRPFRLNGEPIEVQTTITVNFTLGG